MKRIFLMILVVGVLFMSACGASTIHYVNEEFGYSIDYPKDWIMEEIDENKTGVMPGDNSYNQIQIHSRVGEPVIASTAESMFAIMQESDLQLLAETLGSTDLYITTNGPASGQWDWEVVFNLTYEYTRLQGGLFIKETEAITYTVFYLQSTDWLEGQEVINSFSLTE